MELLSGEVYGAQAVAAQFPERSQRQQCEQDEYDVVEARIVERQTVEGLVDVDEEVPAHRVEIGEHPDVGYICSTGKEKPVTEKAKMPSRLSTESDRRMLTKIPETKSANACDATTIRNHAESMWRGGQWRGKPQKR